MKKAVLILLTFIVFLPAFSNAQRWKRQRYELSFGAGISNFLGELGGANQVGTNYFKDLEWSQSRLALAFGLRYKLSNYLALKSHLTYGRVSGDDNLTEETFRKYRNLSFFSDIYEVNVNFEAAFQQEQIGATGRSHRGVPIVTHRARELTRDVQRIVETRCRVRARIDCDP